MIQDIMKAIAAADPEVGEGILKEYNRQRGNIELIAQFEGSAPVDEPGE